MILITGGAYQGKRAYAERQYNLIDEDIIDCGECRPEDILKAKCVCNFQLAVKKMLDSGINPMEFAKRIIEQNSGIIIITDEIGCGIIPLERTDRLWREAVGKTCCILAASSEQVIRVSCGIPIVIKGKSAYED